MSKVKNILRFIIALLNFLFHFKPSPDENSPDVNNPAPGAMPPDSQARDKPLFEDIP